MKDLDELKVFFFQSIKVNCFLFLLSFLVITNWFLEVNLSDGEIVFSKQLLSVQAGKQ